MANVWVARVGFNEPNPSGVVYIGRGKGANNNPLNCKVGEEGYFGNPYHLANESDRLSCLAQYKQYFWARINADPEFLEAVLSLKEKTLVCFCHPKPCHGHVIKAWFEKGCPLAEDKPYESKVMTQARSLFAEVE